MKKLNIIFALFVSLLVAGQAHASKKKEKFELDPAHSSVQFKIRHLIGKVTGSFSGVEGKIDFDGDKPSSLKAWGKIDASTITTGNQKRDEHLKSEDFFDVNNTKKPEYKWITFETTSFSDIQSSAEEIKGKLSGKITIHGVTKPITLDVSVHGKPIIDPWGNERMALSATGTLNRKDFGLDWNKPLEKAGGTMVGDDVELSLEVEASRQDPNAKAVKPAPAADTAKPTK